MPKPNKSDRRRFLSDSAKVVAGATAMANLPSELFAAEQDVMPTADATQPKQWLNDMDQRPTASQQALTATRDLSASVQQSSADKLLRSVNYPLCVFEQRWPFNGREAITGTSYDYTDAEMGLLLKQAQASATTQISSAEQSLEMQMNTDILASAAEVIESAKKCLDASTNAGYKGPDPKEVKKVVDEGVEGLLQTTRGIKFKAHLAWLKVCIADQPSVRLGNPRIAVTGLRVLASATGELWWYHPTFHCSWLCFNWSVTWGWDRITHITLNNVRIGADAHADTSTSGAIVTVRGSFDRLRLMYPILDRIPLEGIANQQLGDKLVRVFDASQFIASVPVLNSRFRIDKVDLPAAANEIAIDLSIKQI